MQSSFSNVCNVLCRSSLPFSRRVYIRKRKGLFFFILIVNMSTSKERAFITGATGAIGSSVVRSLVKQGVDTTAYVRNEEKAKDLFQDELKSNHLTLVIGTYSTIDVYRKAIEGHTRLFLLLAEVNDKPVSFSRIKETFAKIAFEQGVRQVIDLSSASVGIEGKKGVPGYAHTLAEDKLCALADENPEQRSLVILRPGSFMSNHFMGDVHHIKRANKIVSCASPSSTVTWTDTKGKQKESEFLRVENDLFVFLFV